jgi:hypothetical protein
VFSGHTYLTPALLKTEAIFLVMYPPSMNEL